MSLKSVMLFSTDGAIDKEYLWQLPAEGRQTGDLPFSVVEILRLLGFIVVENGHLQIKVMPPKGWVMTDSPLYDLVWDSHGMVMIDISHTPDKNDDMFFTREAIALAMRNADKAKRRTLPWWNPYRWL